MKALVAEGPHKAAFRDVELRPIKDNELLIKVKRAGICATDNAITRAIVCLCATVR